MMRLVILTGASGSGKTAIAEAIRTGQSDLAEVLHFDSIGVPSPEERLAWGSDGAWQRAMTLTWMGRIAAKIQDMPGGQRPVLFEGQMRLAFVQEALLAAGIADARVILVDCDDATRTRRLVIDRRQPELANPQMMVWAEFLRREAKQAACEVLDTSRLSLERCVEHVRAYLTPAYRSAGLPD
jgi:dephospho-CoA kinase